MLPGTTCQVRFRTHTFGSTTSEWMWVEGVWPHKSDWYTGKLMSTPKKLVHLHPGDTVQFSATDIMKVSETK